MPLGIFSLIAPEWTPQELITAARQFGYHGIEWRVAKPGDLRAGPPDFWRNNVCTLAPELLHRTLPPLVAQGRQGGVETFAISPYLDCDQTQEVEALLAVAAAAGVGQMRIRAPALDSSRNYEVQLDAARKSLASIEKLARRHGVRACIEQHNGTLVPSASACRRLVDALDPAAVGIIVDVGNMVVEGYEPFAMVLDVLGPYIAEVHVKNGFFAPTPGGAAAIASSWEVQWCGLREGWVNFDQLRQAMRDRNYNGWLVLEDFSPRPLADRLREGRETLAWLAQK